MTWNEGRHAQVDLNRISMWAGIRSRAWIVGIQGSLNDPGDQRDISLGAMIGPFYVGIRISA